VGVFAKTFSSLKSGSIIKTMESKKRLEKKVPKLSAHQLIQSYTYVNCAMKTLGRKIQFMM
jgi:hypothetical protein